MNMKRKGGYYFEANEKFTSPIDTIKKWQFGINVGGGALFFVNKMLNIVINTQNLAFFNLICQQDLTILYSIPLLTSLGVTPYFLRKA